MINSAGSSNQIDLRERGHAQPRVWTVNNRAEGGPELGTDNSRGCQGTEARASSLPSAQVGIWRQDLYGVLE